MKVIYVLLFVLNIEGVLAQQISTTEKSQTLNHQNTFLADASDNTLILVQESPSDIYPEPPSETRNGTFESTGNGFVMDQNIPNPCNEITSIRYIIPSPGEVEFRVFNLIGKEVYMSLMNVEQGENEFRLDSRDFAQGVYMYTMSFNGVTISKRMVISRK